MSDQLLIGALPLIPFAFGVAGYFWFRRESRKLDRKFGRTSSDE